MVLVHSAPTTLEPYRSKHLGVLSSPRRFYRASEGIETWPWAADNDAFSKWDAERYRLMLESIWGLRGCLFVTAPDIVGGWSATLDRFEIWQPDLAEFGQPIAYVIQDGQPPDWMPWDRIDALFIGGTDQFKMGEQARELVAQAHARGKWVHMGRVNTQQRMRYAKALRCDSIDGTSLSWFRDTYLPGVLAHAAQPPQMLMGTA